MNDRVNFVKSRETEKAGIDKLPVDALEALEAVVKQATSLASV
jgi:phosphoenolpyruvate carboxykinase (ATP)